MKLAIAASLLTGAIWGLLGSFLYSESFNVEIKSLKGITSGAITGGLVTLIFLPVYRFTSKKNLIWITPISLYLSIFLFTFILLGVFYPASGMNEVIRIVGLAWWALTLFFTLWPLFGLSCLNHLAIWHIIEKADQGRVDNA